jgi:hypothetical protein
MLSRTAKLLLAGLLAAGACAAQDLTGDAILSYQKFDSNMFESSLFHQTYDLRLQEMLSDPCQFRLFFRGEDSRGTSDAGGVRSHPRLRQLQPEGELYYFLPDLQFQSRYELIDTRTSTGLGTQDTRRVDRLTGQLDWRPDRLPGLMLEGERRGNRDDRLGLDQTETRLQGGVDYAFHGLRVQGISRLTTLDDGQADFARRSVENQGEVSYEDSFFNGRASVSGGYSATWTRLDERAQAGQSVSIPTAVAIAVASTSVDDSPLDDRDHPLVPTPALVDGNVRDSAGISIGPDAGSYRNIGADLGRVVTLDSFRIDVRDSGGNPVPAGGSVIWSVYVSADGIAWGPVAGGAATAFNAATSLYEVTFAPTASRFFKVLNFGVNSTDTQVTEIEAFFHTTFSPNERRRTNILLTTGTATLLGRPFDPVTVTYYGLFNSVRQTIGTEPRLTTSDSDQIVSALVDPARFLNLTLRYEQRALSQSGGYRQTFDTYTGVVRLAFLQSLTTSLEATHTLEDDAGQHSVTNGLTLRNYARLLPALSLSFDAGRQRQEFTTQARTTDQTSFDAVAIAELTTDLRLTLNATYTRNRNQLEERLPPVDQGVPPARDERYEAELFYRPGRQLGLAARVGYVSSEQASGVIQYYRIEWFPFPGGTLSLGATYDQDVDAYAGIRSRRFIFTPRWTFNPHAILDLNYTRLVQSGNTSSRTSSFLATMTVIF